MKKTIFPQVMAVCLLFVNCGQYAAESDSQYIAEEIRGTWERDIAAFWPEGQTVTVEKGKLILRYETVIITGPVAHLKGFTQNTALEAYTKDNNLYIKDRGVWQSPVPYTLWESGETYLPEKIITFHGGGVSDETFKLVSSLY